MERYLNRIANGCVLLPAFFLLALTGCKKSGSGSRSPSEPLEARPVRVAQVQKLQAEETVAATGSLVALDRAVLSAKVPGRVKDIVVDMGEVVKEGDLLAQIEKRDYELQRLQAEAALAQARALLGLALTGEEDKAEPEKTSIVKEARARLNEAEKNRDRSLKLREEGVIPDAEVETAEAAYQVALSRYDEATHEAKNRIATLKQRQAELAMAEQQLKDTEIRAPFPGIVERRQTSPGEYLSVGAPVATVVRVDPIRARLEVVERDAPRVRLGQRIHLRVGGEELDVKISRMSPVIAAGNRVLLVEADVPNPKFSLRPGSYLNAKDAKIVVNSSPELFVPRSAISTFAGIQKIFLVEQGKAVEKEVKLGREKGDLVEVLGPVEAGAMVVLEPGTLRNGQAVELLANDS